MIFMTFVFVNICLFVFVCFLNIVTVLVKLFSTGIRHTTGTRCEAADVHAVGREALQNLEVGARYGVGPIVPTALSGSPAMGK